MKNIYREYRSTNFITGIRAIAMLSVFLIHGGTCFRELGSFADSFVDCGKFGVQMFFVLSGFTIFYQFFESNYSAKNFVIIRILRISIPYFPLLVFAYLLKGNLDYYSLLCFITNILYIPELTPFWEKSILGTPLGSAWTLNVEVFYYLLFAILISSKCFSKWKLVILVGVVFFTISASIGILRKLGEFNRLQFHFLPFKYGYMFFLGGISYFLRNVISTKVNHLSVTISNNCIMLIMFTAFIVMLGYKYYDQRITETVVVILTSCSLIFVNDKSSLAKLLVNNPMKFLGSISYSVYLIHGLAIGYVIIFPNKIINFVAQLVISILVGFFWYYIFEKNIYNRMKTIVMQKSKTQLNCETV